MRRRDKRVSTPATAAAALRAILAGRGRDSAAAIMPKPRAL